MKIRKVDYALDLEWVDIHSIFVAPKSVMQPRPGSGVGARENKAMRRYIT